jgi:hypothetical protein
MSLIGPAGDRQERAMRDAIGAEPLLPVCHDGGVNVEGQTGRNHPVAAPCRQDDLDTLNRFRLMAPLECLPSLGRETVQGGGGP